MKNRYFSNAPRNHKLEGVKIKLCLMIVLSMYFQKSNFKVGGSARFLGGAGGKIGLNVEKWSFSQGLNREFFQVVPDISAHNILHLFRPSSLPSKLKKNQKSFN